MNGHLWTIFAGLIVTAVVATAATTIDLRGRVAVLESGPRGAEIITRLTVIETQLAQVLKYIDKDERRARWRGDERHP